MGRVIDGGGTNLMLRFQLEMGGNGTKRCQKIKRVTSGNVDRRRGATREGNGRRRCLGQREGYLVKK
jgi:hypothetical protein